MPYWVMWSYKAMWPHVVGTFTHREDAIDEAKHLVNSKWGSRPGTTYSVLRKPDGEDWEFQIAS